MFPSKIFFLNFPICLLGFYGKNNMDMFRVDYVCDCLYEIMHDYMRYFHEKNGRFKVCNDWYFEILYDKTM